MSTSGEATKGVPSDFNTLASDYAKFRTSYSNELFDSIVGYAGIAPGDRVLDVACGTGLSLLPYVHRGFNVSAVDVAPLMMDQARRSLPAGASVEFKIGKAEALPFDDATFDLVSCAQAFHWFDQRTTFAECARVLRPGGSIAIFWKHAARDDIFTTICEQIIRDWLGESAAIASRDHADEHEAGWPLFWQFVAPRGEATGERPFIDGEKRVLEFTLERSAVEFVGYQRSRERIRSVLGPRRADFLRELESRVTASAPGDQRITQRQIQYMFLGRKADTLSEGADKGR